MEINELLEGKKTDNLEDTSASEETKVEDVVNGAEEEKPAEGEVPNLSNNPIPTEEEVADASLEVKPEEVVETEGAEPAIEEGIAKIEEKEEGEPVVEEGMQSETMSEEPVSSENVEPEHLEENGVTEMPATKVFTQEELNDIVGNTRTETREKTFRYIYNRYGVKDEAELDELVGNAQALDSFKEKYEMEKADWKQSSSDRDKELMDVKEQVALLQSGIDSDRFEDAKFILRGKGLEVNLDNIKNEIATHPEWQKKIGNDNPNFAKTGEGTLDMKPAEPTSKISVLGNETAAPDKTDSEEDYVMNRMFKVK